MNEENPRHLTIFFTWEHNMDIKKPNFGNTQKKKQQKKQEKYENRKKKN